MILTPFIQGMKDAGAEVDLFYAKRLKVKPCTGEMHCWYKKAGQCYIKDGMQKVYPILQQADILVLATPVYIPLPGEMQNVINRICPLILPLLETRDGRTRARFRDGVKIKKIVLVATGAWWEIENLDTVKRIALELAEGGNVEFAGAVLRPHAFLMTQKGKLTKDGQGVLEAARKAGHELIKDGCFQISTLDAIARPLISQEELRQRYNKAAKS